MILPRGDGVTAIEALSPEEYLLGIREVPFAWPDEALKTQAVAPARTSPTTSPAGARPRVASTATTSARYRLPGVRGCGRTLLLRRTPMAAGGGGHGRGDPSSITDGPPRPSTAAPPVTAPDESEDIFPGLDVPYLAAVDSPGEDSPFVRWSFAVSRADMESLLDHAGLLSGPLESVRVQTTGDGGGPWQVVVTSGGAQERVDTYRFRSLINAAARDLMPAKLPARRPDGRRYPQTLLSGTFTIRTDTEISFTPGNGPVWSPNRFVINGEGWGHQVGMSQYGALAMANNGSSYSDILAHYYGGLRPRSGLGLATAGDRGRPRDRSRRNSRHRRTGRKCPRRWQPGRARRPGYLAVSTRRWKSSRRPFRSASAPDRSSVPNLFTV